MQPKITLYVFVIKCPDTERTRTTPTDSQMRRVEQLTSLVGNVRHICICRLSIYGLLAQLRDKVNIGHACIRSASDRLSKIQLNSCSMEPYCCVSQGSVVTQFRNSEPIERCGIER